MVICDQFMGNILQFHERNGNTTVLEMLILILKTAVEKQANAIIMSHNNLSYDME